MTRSGGDRAKNRYGHAGRAPKGPVRLSLGPYGDAVRTRLRPAALAAGALVIAVGASACATSKPKETLPAQVTQPAAVTPSESPSPTPDPSPTTAPATLSGRVGVTYGPLLAVKVDNTTKAHPQVGLKAADVIYVEEVEGGVTRLIALYSSQYPTKLGPVRSARITDVDLLPQYGRLAFAFSGAQRRMLPVLARAPFYLISHDAWNKGYVRDHSRPAPYNVIGYPAVMMTRAPKAEKPKPVGYTFGPAMAGGTPTTHVRATWPSARLDLSWSGGRWLAAMDGSPDRAAEGGVLGGTTVVVQYVTIKPSPYYDVNHANTPMSVTTGTGQALILRDGKAYAATWWRPSVSAPTRYYVNGKPAVFAAGQVWILLVDRARPVARS